jgi:single-strand DNA-binding protein
LANLNRIILIGRLTADPEARNTMDGLPMAKFRLAVDRVPNGTDFIDIVVWRELADFTANSLKKGALVLVDGRIQNRSFEDQAGQRRYVTEVVAKVVQMLDKKTAANQPAMASEEPALPAWGAEPEEESVDDTDLVSDLPF